MLVLRLLDLVDFVSYDFQNERQVVGQANDKVGFVAVALLAVAATHLNANKFHAASFDDRWSAVLAVASPTTETAGRVGN